MRRWSGENYGDAGAEMKYKGVRRRRWGKWVSEVRVPGSRERLWLGSYATPEAAAVAYDTAVFHLRGPSSTGSLNFPARLPPAARAGLSPRSIQKAASDVGMAVDAELSCRTPGDSSRAGRGGEGTGPAGRNDGADAYSCTYAPGNNWSAEDALDISVEDMEII